MYRSLPNLFAATMLAALSAPALANGEKPWRAPLLPQYLQECGSCHAAFPPRLLPAASWQRLMGGLSKHFGADASLDPATTQSIAGWLAAQAGRSREAPPDDRITRSAWFQREHRGVAPGTWQLTSVRGPSNCGACHTGAATGSYRESEIRLPR